MQKGPSDLGKGKLPLVGGAFWAAEMRLGDGPIP